MEPSSTERIMSRFGDICGDCRKRTQRLHRVLLQCGCTLCHRCMIKKQASSKTFDLTCKCGGTSKTLIASFDWETEESDDGERIAMCPSNEKWVGELDACRIFMREKVLSDENGNRDDDGIKNRLGDGVLFTSVHTITWDENKKKLNVGVTDYAISSNGDYFPSEDNLRRLLVSQTFLHSAIMPLSRSKDGVVGKDSVETVEKEHDEEDDGIKTAPGLEKDCYSESDLLIRTVQDRAVLPQVVYSLATGNICYRITPDNTGNVPPSVGDVTGRKADPALTAQVSASAIAADLIRRASDINEVGHTLELIAFQLEHASKTQLKKLFSRFRLT